MQYQANMTLKLFALLVLFVLLARPSAYVSMWERGNWFIIILCPLVLPFLLLSCVRILVWRVRISSSTIEIRSLRGLLTRRLAELTRVERLRRRIVVAFSDGSRRIIPAIVGDLDRVADEIAARRNQQLG